MQILSNTPPWPNSGALLEGAFWTSWCGLNLWLWNESLEERRKLDHIPPTSVHKALKIWEANKVLSSATASAIAGLSMFFCWAHEVAILPLGRAISFVSGAGYLGGGVASAYKTGNALKQLKEGAKSFFDAKDSRSKRNIAVDQITTALKVSFFTFSCLWGLFGAADAFIGGDLLFYLMDTSLYYCLLNFCALLVAYLITPLLKDNREVPC